MRYVDEAVLRLYRGPGRCALCGTFSPQREAHHVFSRGAGRLDIPINLVSLGGAWSCQCHTFAQQYITARARVVEAAAFREGLDYPFVAERVPWLRRQPKECQVCPACLGAGSVRMDHWWGIRRHECAPCRGVGALDAAGEPWVEPARVPSWEGKT